MRRFWSTLILALLVGAAHAGTFYVAPTGDDAAAGTQVAPWKTIQKAVLVAKAGDTTLIQAGEYPGGVTFRTGGTKDQPITFRCEGNVLIRGDQTTNRDALFVDRAPYVVLEGFRVEKAVRAGIRISLSNGCTMRNNRCLNGGVWGIFTDYSDDLVIEGNECAGSGREHGIYVSNSGDRPILRGNVCHDNAGAGIQVNADAWERVPEYGTTGDGWTDGAVIVNNECYGNGVSGAAGINLASVKNSLIANNLIHDNKAGGIAAWDNDVGKEWGSRDNLFIYNTVLFQPGVGRWCVSLKNGSTGNVLRNNILVGGKRGAIELDNDSSVTSDYNLLRATDIAAVVTNEDTGASLTLPQWQAAGQDVHSINVLPMLGMDFVPLVGSPMIDRGLVDVRVVGDKRNFLRPVGVSSDLGCFELGATVPVPGPTPVPVPMPTPISDPTTDGTTLTVGGVTIKLDVTVIGATAPAPAPQPAGMRPAAPTNLTLQVKTYNNTPYAELTWVDSSTDELAFLIWRRTTAEWKVIGTATPGGKVFTDWEALKPGTVTREYRITAAGEAGISQPSNTVVVAP